MNLTIYCPGCRAPVACAPYSHILPDVVGRWLIPDHRAAHENRDHHELARSDTGKRFVITQRCAWSGAYVEREA